MSKKSTSSLSLQPSAFLPDLKKMVVALSEDLLTRSALPEIDQGLREAYTQIEKGGRTADPFEVWRDDYLDQVAVAWVLGCVFVRFMEDNHLIDECWLAGQGERRKQAEDTHELYFRENPRQSDREYFEHVFHEVGKIPACRDLFAEGKTPLWAVGPSGDAAMKLLAFWREIDTDSGQLKRTFEVEDGDTRFLGDLYQDLSEKARKKYALLQTPVFVEEFILDRTLNPAIDEFGLDVVRMIDPTCGSGHFLLGGFARLFDLWAKREDNEIVAAQKALDGVWGVDVNPFAVAIARFRLIVAAMRACGIKRLKSAPAWNIHLATGDSLLFGNRWNRTGQKRVEQTFFATEEESWAPEIYACEDKEEISRALGQQYHAVVGNPPYITVKDKALNQAYRDRYATCHRQYSLSVPFMERFFDLAVAGGTTTSDTNNTNGKASGYVGQITANSFMKREFGKKLIEEYFAKVDLTHVIDTSGAYIPGHGTPTVILFGRNREPVGQHVRAVLGIKGEPSAPADPGQGFVWQSIVKHIDVANGQDAFTSTADVPRATFTSHPWSIGGGGAVDVKTLLEVNCLATLSYFAREIGFGAVTREDDAYLVSEGVARRHGVPDKEMRPLVSGDEIRDWRLPNPTVAIFPYDPKTFLATASSFTEKFLWRWKTQLSIRVAYGHTQLERGLKWFEYSMFFTNRFQTPLSIAFAFVATHNHFVLDRGGKVFKQSAPIIKLPADATEDDHFALLGLLNSSTACFWMKQTFHNKGSTVDQHGARQRTDAFEDFYEFTGTGLLRFPVPAESCAPAAQLLDELATSYSALLPDAWLTADVVPTKERLAQSQAQAEQIRLQMIALQEELDWQCYEMYGLLNRESDESGTSMEAETAIHVIRKIRGCSLGQRAFEIVMARQMAAGELETTWFERHGSTPITEIPGDWPEDYRSLVERRIHLIESNKEIGLIERPEYKRRWNTERWEDQQERALRNWLLDRLESYWKEGSSAQPAETRLRSFGLHSVAQLADLANSDQKFLQVAAIYRGRDDFNLAALVAELVGSESVPCLPVLRYKTAGLRKRELWERTWELQREEDRLTTTNDTNQTNRAEGQAEDSSIRPIRDIGGSLPAIPVPPKYTSADFLTSDYWRLRGKLDVAKERWISFPHCETASDPSLVIGWAGWNHLQQGTAIVAYYDARKNEGWSAEQLKPLLAALDQLLPWIHQWHPEIDPEYNETAGTSFQTLLESEAQELGLTLEQIRNWTPPERKGGRRKAEGGSEPRKPRSTRKKAAADEDEDNHE